MCLSFVGKNNFDLFQKWSIFSDSFKKVCGRFLVVLETNFVCSFSLNGDYLKGGCSIVKLVKMFQVILLLFPNTHFDCTMKTDYSIWDGYSS
jgi:hypothetical protein